eukprot:GHVL01027410.1.p1 GENE.GHVL01027410.1~~GHVL01027410.1.p1  ORF type:complete len:665 (+),score=212.34 GHVL01027410.1:36-2030(+)
MMNMSESEGLYEKLISLTSATILHEPNFIRMIADGCDEYLNILQKIIIFDPQFPLKLCLYIREDLHIRSTANFILAYVANEEACRAYLPRYFNNIIKLPSDMMQVALYIECLNTKQQNVEHTHEASKKVIRGYIPCYIRKLLINRFILFTEFDFSKYKKKIYKEKTVNGTVTMTLKRLVRLLHISKPEELIIKILGKRVNDTRMKLKTPNTWEVRLSENGNNAKTWEELIDSRSLSYMATLRNLRNIILSGVSKDYHQKIMDRIIDVSSIMKSKLQPFSYLSAFKIIKNIPNIPSKMINNAKKLKGIQKESDVKKWESLYGLIKILKKRNKKIKKCKNIDSTCNGYKISLNNAIKTSVSLNLEPIGGKTLVCVKISDNLRYENIGGNTKSVSNMKPLDISYLLCIMMKYGCENVIIILYIENNNILLEIDFSDRQLISKLISETPPETVETVDETVTDSDELSIRGNLQKKTDDNETDDLFAGCDTIMKVFETATQEKNETAQEPLQYLVETAAHEKNETASIPGGQAMLSSCSRRFETEITSECEIASKSDTASRSETASSKSETTSSKSETASSKSTYSKYIFDDAEILETVIKMNIWAKSLTSKKPAIEHGYLKPFMRSETLCTLLARYLRDEIRLDNLLLIGDDIDAKNIYIYLDFLNQY